MSKANPVTPSRRALVAGIAAAPALALPAVANVPARRGNLAGEKIPDPVFAALDACRKAEAEWRAASRAFNEAEAEWHKVEHQFPDYVLLEMRGLLADEAGGFTARCREHREVEQHFKHWDCLCDVAAMQGNDEQTVRRIYEARRVAAHKELRLRMERYDAERDRRRLPELEEAAEETMTVWCEAEDTVMATKPITLAGAIALIGFARERVHGGAQGEQIEPALEGIEAFLKGTLEEIEAFLKYRVADV